MCCHNAGFDDERLVKWHNGWKTFGNNGVQILSIYLFSVCNTRCCHFENITESEQITGGEKRLRNESPPDGLTCSTVSHSD